MVLHGRVTLQREYIKGVHNWICNSHDMRKTETAVVSRRSYEVFYLVLYLVLFVTESRLYAVYAN